MGDLMEIRLAETGSSLSPKQLQVVRSNFRGLDRDRDGVLSRAEVGALFRAFGQNPTDAELGELLKDVPSKGLNLDGFVDFFTTFYQEPLSEETLVSAFHVFDNDDHGTMSAAKFKELVTTEAMSLEEADEILRAAKVDENGMFDYRKLAHCLIVGPL